MHVDLGSGPGGDGAGTSHTKPTPQGFGAHIDLGPGKHGLPPSMMALITSGGGAGRGCAGAAGAPHGEGKPVGGAAAEWGGPAAAGHLFGHAPGDWGHYHWWQSV